MTIVIENADNTVLEMLEFLKKERKIDFNIREEEPYSKSMVRSLLRERKIFSKKLKKGTVKTYSTAQEAFADVGLL